MKYLKQASYSVLLPFLIYILHSLLFRNWIVDDAGISFAYARNLADGYGLTSWKGMPPVEGFSDFLWTALFSFFFLLKLFHPVITPKIIGALFVLGVFIYSEKTILSLRFKPYHASAVNLLLAVNTPFVVWSQSGMENSLFAFLLSLICYFIIRFFSEEHESLPGRIGFVAFLIAITRPEGIFFGLAFPLTLLFIPVKNKLSSVWHYSAALALPFICFLLFRYSYFHDIFPNTVYTKTHASFLQSNSFRHFIDKFHYLSFAIGGRWAIILVLFSLFIAPFLIKYFNRKNKLLSVPVVFFLLAFAHFMLMPDDWMRELRFATPFILFSYIYLLILIFFLQQKYKLIVPAVVISFFACLFIYSSWHFYKRSITFSKNLTVPLSYVKENFADTFNNYSKELRFNSANVFLPDLGGTLFYSDIKVYDAAGLCDRTVAKTLYINPIKLHEYIFEDIKPTFIHLHNTWSLRINPDADIRFRRDYIPIYEYKEESLSMVAGRQIMSGNYIRKDVINESNKAALDSITAEANQEKIHW